ncbi:MAG: hypothetical protein WCD66_02365 [Rhodanobacteraceae bacterium]
MTRIVRNGLLAISLVCAGSLQAMAGPASGDKQRVIPVLVNVNTKGEVTRIDPAVTLRPVISKALQQTVKGMIHKPAMKDGKAISSQFVLNLAIVSDKQADNEYTFSYVSAQPVPSGSWHWTHRGAGQGGPRYALQSNTGAGVNVNLPRDTYSTMASPPTPHPRTSNSDN